VNEHPARLPRLEQALQDQVKSWRLNTVVEARQTLRGVPFTVAVTIVEHGVISCVLILPDSS
jgi:hypothetical protein